MKTFRPRMAFNFSALSATLRENSYGPASTGVGGSGSPLTIRVIPSFIRSNPKFKAMIRKVSRRVAERAEKGQRKSER